MGARGKAEASKLYGSKHNYSYKIELYGKEKYEINLSLFKRRINFNEEQTMN